MTEPKVSKKIETLLTEYALAVVYSATNDGLGSKEVGQTRRALLSAIAEIEQRAGEIDFFASIVQKHYADIVMPTVEDRSAAKPSDWINCAILELGNQHKRAEKWKEAAVAFYQCSRELADIGCKDFALTNNRLDAAIAALGDEWDEAIKEKHHG